MRNILIFGLCVASSICHVDSAAADYLYDVADALYTENFDSLSSSGNSNAWADDITLQGWLASESSYRASNGRGNTGALYSFGDDADLALGSISSNGTGTIEFGLRLTNATGGTLDQFTVAYDGEQWRNAGQQVTQSLNFSYAVGTGLSLGSTTTAVPQLDFAAPVFTNAAGNLDGNAAANRIAGITFQVSGIQWANGQQLLLKFSDPNSSGVDHGLAVDNFRFSAGAAVPEPSTCWLLGMTSLLAMGYRRRVNFA